MTLIGLAQIAKFLAALAFVVALMGGLALVMKRLNPAMKTVGAGQKRRLSIVETLPLDARRRAVILKCDEREYLTILGATNESPLLEISGEKKDV